MGGGGGPESEKKGRSAREKVSEKPYIMTWYCKEDDQKLLSSYNITQSSTHRKKEKMFTSEKLGTHLLELMNISLRRRTSGDDSGGGNVT
jgi:hypothetical protein